MVLRIDREKAQALSFDEVLEHWYGLFSGHLLADRYRAGESLSQAERGSLNELVEQWRRRLYDLGWFMVTPAHPCAPRHSYIPVQRAA